MAALCPLFAVNGQVHGSWNTEFITRSLKMPLLKDYLLILVDCTRVKTAFRNDLFMASRDRMVNSEQSRELRDALKSILLKSELRDIHERRKQGLGIDASEATRAIRNYVRDLTLKPEVQKLLAGQLDLDHLSEELGRGDSRAGRQPQKKQHPPTEGTAPPPEPPFVGKKFPSFFRLARPTGNREATPAARIPLGESRTVRFYTDVEDEYLQRIEQPGRFDLALVRHHVGKTSQVSDESGSVRAPRTHQLPELLHVQRTGPEGGGIKLRINPGKEARIGDSIQVQATLSGQLTDFPEWFWVRIIADKQPNKDRSGDDDKGSLPGLPDAILVGKEQREDSDIQATWDDYAASGIDIDASTVVIPIMDGDHIEKIVINMDSEILTRYKAEQTSADATQLHLLDNRYVASMYLHTLLIGGGMSARGYMLRKPVLVQQHTRWQLSLVSAAGGHPLGHRRPCG